MIRSMFASVKSFILSIFIVLITISYLPSSFSADGEMVGTYSRYIQLLAVGLFGLCLYGNTMRIFSSRVIIRFIALLFGFFVLISGFIGIGLMDQYAEIPSLLIVLITICTGYTLDISEKSLKAIVIIYILTMIYVGYQQIEVNIGAFVIEDQYLTSAKNSLGPLLTIAGVSAMFLTLQKEITGNPRLDFILKLVLIIAAITCFIELLTIRARMATIAYMLIGGFILFKYIRQTQSSYYKWVIYALCLGTIILLCQNNELREYITDSFFQDKEDDMLSNRAELNSDALDILKSSPFLGNITEARTIDWVHNYPLRILSDYGIIGSAFLLILYLYLLLIIVRKCWHINVSAFTDIGYLLLAISFLVSLAEPTFPYGPGTVNYLPFLLFGVAMSNERTHK